MTEVPSELLYSPEHEWVRSSDGVVRVGITAHAADQLGDIVYASLPTVGVQVVAGDSCAELESTKSVSDVFAPVSGVVSAVNETLADAPETVNTAPYGEGWLFEVEAAAGATDGLLSAAEYQKLIGA